MTAHISGRDRPVGGTRVLGIEMRRSSALRSAALIGVCGFALIYLLVAAFGPVRWWFSLVVDHRSLFMLTAGPLALGAGAWLGRRDRRSRMDELLASTPRPRFRRVLPTAGALAIALGAAYLGALALAGALGVRPIGTYFPFGALPVIANGVLALIALGWLGLAIGSLLPWPLTPPVLAILGFAVLVVVPQATAAAAETRRGTWLLVPELQNPLGGPMAFLTVSARVNLAQTVWLAARTGSALALLAAASRRARVIALIPAVLGAAIAVPLLPERSNDMYVPDRRANEPVCTSDAPTICVDRVDGHLLPELVGPGRQALAILADKLPPAPDRVEVYLWYAPDRTDQPGCRPAPCAQPVRPAEVMVVELGYRGYEEAPPIPADDYLWYLLDGAGTAPCDSVDGLVNDRYLAARLAAAQWLIGTPEPRGPQRLRTLATAILAGLTSAPVSEQRARVAALRAAELTCAPGDRGAILTGDDGR